MTAISFVKMHGCGNDFIVADNRALRIPLEHWIAAAPALCARRTGVGADGMLLLESSDKADFTMVYRNADGSDAGMCGNGGRCIAAFATTLGFRTEGRFDVHGRMYSYSVVKDGADSWMVDLKFPVSVVPEMRQSGPESYLFAYTGTEHLVVPATPNRLTQTDWLRTRGAALRNNLHLSKTGANVNFVARKDGLLCVQTFERGVEDLTLACGTGVLASAIGDHFASGRTTPVVREQVHVEGGDLFVSFQVEPITRTYTDLVLSGPAVRVFQGTLDLPS